MRAITIPTFGGPDALVSSDIPIPELGPNDVLVEVAAAGLNRADIAQREGHYPPPPGAPDWPGMELSGTIVRIGDAVTGWHAGNRVCALVPGGAYAEFAAVDVGLLLPVGDHLDLVDSAGIPEAAATVWANVFMAAGLSAGQTFLVHGGSSGVGSMAIQLGTAFGAQVFATAGSADKVAFCEHLGARGINYREQDFVEILKREAPRGVDVVLDIVGGAYLARNIDVLALNGTIMVIANQSGDAATFDFGRLMRTRGRIWSTTLRARPLADRTAILSEVAEQVMPLYETGRVRTVTDTVFPLEDAPAAHRRMETSEHLGKILLAL